MIKFPITCQSVKDMAVETATVNGFPLCSFEKSGIVKMLAPILNQLNLKLIASNVQAWTIEAYQRKITETKKTFAGKMVSVKVDLCT